MSAPLSPKSGGVHAEPASSSPSNSSSPIPGASDPTPFVSLDHTLSDILDIRSPIETALAVIPKNAPNKQELANAVDTSITGCQELLANNAQVPVATKAHADNLYRLLRAAHVHLQDRHLYGKRAQMREKVNSLFGRPETPPPTTYHLDIPVAFDALKNSLLPLSLVLQSDTANARSTPATTNPRLQDTATESARELLAYPDRVSLADERILEEPAQESATKQVPTDVPKKDGPRGTIVDTIEGGLGLLSSVTDFIPAPAGPIVKLMAGTGLTIIQMLQDMGNNREEAMDLGRYTAMFIQIAGRFLERPTGGPAENCDAETIKQLQSFLDTLKALETNLVQLKAQGRFKQGVSHKTNKDDLKQWETRISRAFATLQTQLSLDSIRLLTRMNASDALRERDRLIGLLGDGDIGATEKAANAIDLMCLPGTRTEVLDQVDQWIADPSGSRIFWISGVAGCGKSAVAATIAGRPRAIPTSIAVFYFVRGNQGRNKRVLCSLSRQLAQFGHGSLEHFILSNVKAKPDIAASHLDTQFRHIIVDPLKKIVPGSPPVILVVDALDEWNNHDAVINLVKLIQQSHKELPSTIRFVLTSRNEPHLVKSLESTSMKSMVTRYPLDAVLKTDAGRDIRKYIIKRFVAIRADSDIDEDEKPWPKRENVNNLVMLSDGLFQWAATVMSYIGGLDPPDRLRYILISPERYRGLDNLYRGVLEGSPEEEMDERIPHLLQNVLGAILTARQPRDATTIGYLCCDDLDRLEETRRLIQRQILPRLASMFIVPKDSTQPIKVSHKSVHDYLTTKDRCADPRFFTDVDVHHERIIHSCFRLMGSKLKQDICSINNPSKLNKDVQNQITASIPPGLRYLCEHWVEYLPSPGQGGVAASRGCLEQFSQKHLLHWLEVMSLIGRMDRVVPIALAVERWLLACPSRSPTDEATQRLWGDTQRFVAMFIDPISVAAAHIYISALRLAPSETLIVRQSATLAERGLRVIGELTEKEWPQPAWTAKGHTGRVCSTSFSHDGSTILSASGDSTLRIWDAESGAQKGDTLRGHTAVVHCASFSPDGKTIVSGSEDNTLRLWDAELGAPKGEALVGHWKGVQSALFSPDGRTILSGSEDNTLRLWNAELGAQKGEALEGHTATVWSVSFSPDGKLLLSASEDDMLRFWDAETGAQKGKALEGHTKGILCASFSPDGKKIVSGSGDATLRLWGAESGAQIGEALEGHTAIVWFASFSPDGKTILSGSDDGTARLWDVESGAQKGKALGGPNGSRMVCASFSPDGHTILSGLSDNTLQILDVYSGVLKVEPQNGHLRGVSCFVFSLDGETIVSGSYDKTVRLWDAETGVLKGEPLNTKGMVLELSFSDDGFTLIGKTYDGSSQEWDVSKYVHAKSDPTRRDPVFKGSVSPEGWIFHRDIRWFWVPFSYADWLLCGSRLALRRERVVYIFDVSEIMYIVE